MDEEIREEQLDDDGDEQDVEAHVRMKWSNPEDDEEQERFVLKK
jgi:hypothetical protein